MTSKSFYLALAFTTALVVNPILQLPREAHAANCEPSDKIDGSTIDSARKKIEAAGFRQVRDLSKGCDNYWHGKAIKDGNLVNVVLSPQGKVMIEGD